MRFPKHLTSWLLILLILLLAGGLANAKVASEVQNLSAGVHLEEVSFNLPIRQAKIDVNYDAASESPIAAKRLLGQDFGKLGTVVEKPNIQISGVAKHFVNRKIQRGVSSSQALGAINNPSVVLKQSNGGHLFLNNNAAVVVDKNGNLITTYGSKHFDPKIKGILEKVQ